MNAEDVKSIFEKGDPEFSYRDWFWWIQEMCWDAVTNVKLIRLFNKELSMRISDYVDIWCIYQEFDKLKSRPYNACRFISGVLIEGNILDKSMKTDYSNPKILILKGSLDIN